MIDIDSINKKYKTSIVSITRSELEEALLQTFGSFGYRTFEYEGKTNYFVGTDFNWESYDIENDEPGNDMDDAITKLFLKYSKNKYFKDIISRLNDIPF